MKSRLGMLRPETLHVFGLVRRQVVEHYMNLLSPFGAFDRAGQKRDELLRGVPRRGHAMHFAGLHVLGLRTTTMCRDDSIKTRAVPLVQAIEAAPDRGSRA